jgi:hypothetical protein
MLNFLLLLKVVVDGFAGVICGRFAQRCRFGDGFAEGLCLYAIAIATNRMDRRGCNVNV